MFNKLKPLFILTILILCVFSNLSLNAQEIEKINIPGTKVFFPATKGYEISREFTGLKKSNDIIIKVDVNLRKNVFSFLKKMEVEILNRGKDTLIDGYQAHLFRINNDSDNLFLLILGDSTFTVVLEAEFPDNIEIEEEVLQLMKKVSYDKTMEIDPHKSYPFSLNDSNSPLKFSIGHPDFLVYTLNGEAYQPGPEQEKPYLFIEKTYSKEAISPENLVVEKIEDIKRNGLEYIISEQGNTQKVNGYDAYEAILVGSFKNETIKIYLLSVFHKREAVVMFGLDFNGDFIEKYKSLSRTIQFKN